jgi:hypothetical protein
MLKKHKLHLASDRTRATAARLGGADPFQLPFAAQIGLEFGEHAEHVEERLAGRSAGIHRLLSRFQRDAAGLQLVHDVLEVFQQTRQAEGRPVGLCERLTNLEAQPPTAPQRRQPDQACRELARLR